MNAFAPDVVALLQNLIRIPSINPEGSGEGPGRGERRCAEHVAECLSFLGAEVVLEEVLPDRPNVIGRFPGPEEGPGILFAPHTDTVSVEGMTIDPFGGEVRDGRVYGRGASDTKGTMAAMLWALYEVRDQLPRLGARIGFVGLMGEEASQPGSRDFARRHADEFDFAVVGEPTELDTVYSHKGCTWLEISAEGVSCHGSTPHLGDNAILRLTPLLDPMLERLGARLPDFEDPVLGRPTISLGLIRGGSSPNIVPDRCTAILDCRVTPALAGAGGPAKLVEETLAEMPGGEAIRVMTRGESAPLATDPETDGIQRLLSIGSELATAPWFCDAGCLAEAGIASVACGPGKIAQAHTKDEFLAIADLEAGAEFYANFIRTFER